MPSVAPASQDLVELVVAVPEGLRTDHGPVVVAPPANDRVEPPDQVFLRQVPAMADEVCQAVQVELHFSFAGFDVGLEAQGSSPAVRPRMVLAHRELTNGEAQEIKAHRVVLRVQGMTQAGLLLVAAGFGNPDATDGLGPGIQVKGVDQVQAFGRLQAGDAVNAGSLLTLVVLGDTSDGKQFGVPGAQQ